jgi:hypothetical protein
MHKYRQTAFYLQRILQSPMPISSILN